MAKTVAERLEEARRKREQGKSNEKEKDKSSGNSVADRLQRHRDERAIGFDTITDDVNALNDTINAMYSGWQDAQTMESNKNSLSAMLNRLNSYSNYMKTYGQSGEDLDSHLKEIQGIYDQFNTAYTGFDDWAKLYSEFDSADKYNSYMKEQEEDKKRREKERSDMLALDTNAYAAELKALQAEYEAAQKEYSQLFNEAYGQEVSEAGKKRDAKREELFAYENEIERRKAYLWEAQNLQKYEGLSSNEDWTEMSTKVADKKTAGFGIGIGTKWWGQGDPVYDYINNIEGYRFQQIGASALRGDQYGIYSFMLEDEINRYNYLYNTEGRDSANKYLEYLEYELGARRAGVIAESAKLLANEAPILADVLSVGGTLVSGIGYLDALGQEIGNSVTEAVTGEYAGPINYNTVAMAPSQMATGIRGQRAKNITNEFGVINLDPEDHPYLSRIFNGKGLADVYQLGMSMADSLTVAGLSMAGVPTWLGTGLLAGSAATQGTLDAVARGATDDEALAMGAFNGAAEYLFERFEIDGLLKNVSAGKIRGIALQSLTEGFGEGATTVANTLSDALIMAEKSNWQASINEYLKQNPNMTTEEATKQAFWDAVIQVGWDITGGAIMGGVTTAGGIGVTKGVQGVMNVADRYTAGKQILNADGGANALKNLANEMSGVATEKSTKAGIEKLSKKVTDKKGIVNTMNVGKLYQTVKTAVTEQNITDIAKSLERKGFSAEEAKSIAGALAVSANGMQLSEKQAELLQTYAKDERVQKTFRDVVANPKSTTGQTRQKVNTLAREVITDTVGKSTVATGSKNTQGEGISTPSKHEVSVDGKTHLRGQDEVIDSYEIADIKDGEITLKLSNGDMVSADEVSFSSNGEALMVEAFADVGMSADGANAFLKSINADNGLALAKGIKEVFTYGSIGYPMEAMSSLGFSSALTKTQQEHLYTLAQEKAQKATDEAQGAVDKAFNDAVKYLKDHNIDAGRKHGTVSFEKGAMVAQTKADSQQKKRQTEAIEAAKVLAYITGLDFVFYSSGKGSNGRYDPKTGKVHIDLLAGFDANSLCMYTISHELLHFAKEMSPQKYKLFSQMVLDAFTKSEAFQKRGWTLDDLIQNQIDAAEEDGRKLTRDEAYEEVIADACESLLVDGGFEQLLTKIEARDKGLFNELKQFFQKMLRKLKNFFTAYSKVDPNSAEANIIRSMTDEVQKIVDAFTDMLQDASQKNATIRAAQDAGMDIGIITDGAVAVDADGNKHSIRSMQSDLADARMFRDLMSVCGWTQAQADALKNNLETLVKYMIPYRNILDMNETYGREGRKFSPFKPNSDPLYKISMDFSTLCSKRLLTQFVIENLQLQEKRPMSAEEQMAIRHMLNQYRQQEKGLQVACAMCYVEAARLKSPKQMQKWLDDPGTAMRNYFADKNKEFSDYIKEKQADFKESKGFARDATKDQIKSKPGGSKVVTELNKIRPRLREQYKPTAEELAVIERAKNLPVESYLSAENLAELSANEDTAVIYKAYTDFIRTATRSKALETDEPYYYGDSERDNGNGIVVTDSFIEAVNRENGMRFSSWSDWRIEHLLDYITAIIDLSVRQSAMHGYTKFPDEVRVLGKTGAMFNMSGVAGTQTGLNPDGSLNFSETESIDVNEAIQLREEFPETAGLQCIGVSDAHIYALLRSDIIDYIIPYHVSGLNKTLRRMADIYGWDDYTGTQNAQKDPKAKYEGKEAPANWQVEPVWSEFFVGYDTDMSGIEAMRATADRYKQMCRERGLIPKFDKFSNEPNYWKLLIDRKMINQQTGELIEQKPVQPIFDFSEDGPIYGVINRYVENFDKGLKGRALKHIKDNWDSIPSVIRELKKNGTGKAKSSKDIMKTLAAVANETLAAKPKNTAEKNSSRHKTIDERVRERLANTPVISGMIYRSLKGRDSEVVFYGAGKADGSFESKFAKNSGFRIYDDYSFDVLPNGSIKVGNWRGGKEANVGDKALAYIQNAVTPYIRTAKAAVESSIRADIEREMSRDERTLERIQRKFGASDEQMRRAIALAKGENPDILDVSIGVGFDDGVKNSSRKKMTAEQQAHYQTEMSGLFDAIAQTKNHTGKYWSDKTLKAFFAEHPDVDFVEKIYKDDKSAVAEFKEILASISDEELLNDLSWYVGETYKDKGHTFSVNWETFTKESTYPYRGAVRKFRNAIKSRVNEIMTQKNNGTNLGVVNGKVTLDDMRSLFAKLNTNTEMTRFAEKVFDTADELGVSIEFVNDILSKKAQGVSVGDIIQYKTSYFNDTAVADQSKAEVILHEVIHACTSYALYAAKNYGSIDANRRYSSYPIAYENLIGAAKQLNSIYEEISRDPDFRGEYGIESVHEMVAELSNPVFVEKLQKKNLWDRIVDAICKLFGVARKTDAYSNIRTCVDYLLENFDSGVYEHHAKTQRSALRQHGKYDLANLYEDQNVYSSRKQPANGKAIRKVLSGTFFSGGGTVDFALSAILDSQFAVEYEAKISTVYQQNNDTVFMGKDVLDFDPEEWAGKIDYFHASPVCKTYSTAISKDGKRKRIDTGIDKATAEATAKALRAIQPKTFTLENVPHYEGTAELKLITDALDDLGYNWDIDTYNSADYGAATSRERVFIRAVKDGDLPAKPQKVSKRTTWYDVTKDLIPGLTEKDSAPNWLLERLKTIGIDVNNLSQPLFVHTDAPGATGVPHAYADSPAPTITANEHMPMLFMPDGRMLEVSPRMLARISGLPDNYQLPPQKGLSKKIIGNGVPVKMTQAVVGSLLNHITGQDVAYSTRKQGNASNRYILANALEKAAKNPTEKEWLSTYKANYAEADALEQQLLDVNRQVKELTFGTGPKDRSKLAELKNKQKILVNKLKRVDGKLLQIEASKPLADLLAREKARVEKDVKAKARKSRQEELASRNNTIMRHKIQGVVKDIDKLLNRGNKDKNVKLGLQDTISKALQFADVLFAPTPSNAEVLRSADVDMSKAEESSVNEYLAYVDRRDAITAKLKEIRDGVRNAEEYALAFNDAQPKIEALEAERAQVQKEIDRLSKDIAGVIERARRKVDEASTVSDAIKNLAMAYKRLEGTDISYLQGAYDEFVYDHILLLEQEIGTTKIRNMNAEQLRQVYDMFKMMQTAIRDANKLFLNGKKQEKAVLGYNTINEVNASGKAKESRSDLTAGLRKFGWNTLTIDTVVEILNSSTLKAVVDDIKSAQGVYAKDTEDARTFFAKVADEVGYWNWDKDKTYTFTSTDGGEFSIGIEAMMLLYAYQKRKQAMGHLEGKGFSLRGTKKSTKMGSRTINESTTYLMMADKIAEVVGVMEKEYPGAKKYVDALQGYLSTTMGAKGNEVSEYLYGIDLFVEQYYVPLMTDSQFLDPQDMDKKQGTAGFRRKNSGFTKATVKNATKAITLGNFTEVWAGHVVEMANYHAMVIPLDTMEKLLNFHDGTVSVHGTIEHNWGSEAVQYLRDYINDLNGGIQADKRGGFFEGLIGLQKMSAVALSASVVVQQPTAVFRAMQEIDPKYFLILPKRNSYEQLKQYSPIAVIKQMGGFDTHTGRGAGSWIVAQEYKGLKEKAKGLLKDKDYRSEAYFWMAGKADEVTWSWIWQAILRETKAKHPNLVVGSKEFMEAAGKRADDVLSRTQVYDSTVSKSGLMRSSNGITKMATAFMGEPTVGINNLVYGFAKGKHIGGAKGAKYFAGVATSVVAAQIAASLAKAFIQAGRDDDEDKDYWEKYLDKSTDNLVSEVLLMIPNSIPYVRDLVSMWQGWDIERTDMALLGDLIDSIQAWDSDRKTTEEKISQTAGAIGNLFGIPFKNVYRDLKALVNVISEMRS